MNIFVLDEDPVKAAQLQCDKHCVKMILESAQILCTAIRSHVVIDTPYKSTHKNHPSTLWAQKTLSNFEWLLVHSFALCEEYIYRYEKVHSSESVILWAAENKHFIPPGDLTPFALAMPEHLKQDNVVLAYRAYYKHKKSILKSMTWKKRSQPEWFIEEQ